MSADPAPPPVQFERWAVLLPDSRLYVHDDADDEEAAWRIALGWPSPEEIADAKARGARAFKVIVSESQGRTARVQRIRPASATRAASTIGAWPTSAKQF